MSSTKTTISQRVPLSPEGLAYRVDIGAQLRARRDKLGLTQAEVAARMTGTHPSDLAKIEKGALNVTVEKLRQAAEAVEMDLVLRPRRKS